MMVCANRMRAGDVVPVVGMHCTLDDAACAIKPGKTLMPAFAAAAEKVSGKGVRFIFHGK
jgi:hypothetical protein